MWLEYDGIENDISAGFQEYKTWDTQKSNIYDHWLNGSGTT